MVKFKKFFGWLMLGIGEYFLIKMGRLIALLVCLSLLLSSSAVALGQKTDEIGVGSLAPDFSLKDLNEEEIKLSNFKDKEIVILVFWATRCPYCLKEIPALKKIDEEYKDKGVKILALNIKEGEDKLTSFVDKYDIPYTISIRL
jgi:thiol-disulfide isomerase/thioredoxin